MTYIVAPIQPPLRDASLAYDAIGPGLYDDGEVLVQIGTDYCAISVDIEWLDNGAGTVFKSIARWCAADGSTLTCPKGAHVESGFSHTALPSDVNTFGVQAIAKDVMLMTLGEQPLLERTYTNADGTTGTQLMFNYTDDFKANVSITQQISNVQAITNMADAKTILS